MSFELAIMQAVFETLSTNSVFLTKNISVYDDIPQPNDSGSPKSFPYVVIGDDSFANWDTDTELGMQVDITIHTWSRYSGTKETKELQGYVYDALHRVELIAAGYHCLSCDCVDSKTFLDVDGKTRHGVQIFTVYIEKT